MVTQANDEMRREDSQMASPGLGLAHWPMQLQGNELGYVPCSLAGAVILHGWGPWRWWDENHPG